MKSIQCILALSFATMLFVEVDGVDDSVILGVTRRERGGVRGRRSSNDVTSPMPTPTGGTFEQRNKKNKDKKSKSKSKSKKDSNQVPTPPVTPPTVVTTPPTTSSPTMSSRPTTSARPSDGPTKVPTIAPFTDPPVKTLLLPQIIKDRIISNIKNITTLPPTRAPVVAPTQTPNKNINIPPAVQQFLDDGIAIGAIGKNITFPQLSKIVGKITKSNATAPTSSPTKLRFSVPLPPVVDKIRSGQIPIGNANKTIALPAPLNTTVNKVVDTITQNGTSAPKRIRIPTPLQKKIDTINEKSDAVGKDLNDIVSIGRLNRKNGTIGGGRAGNDMAFTFPGVQGTNEPTPSPTLPTVQSLISRLRDRNND